MDSISKKYQNIPSILKNMSIWLCYDDNSDKPKAPRDIKGNLHSINGRLYTFNQCLESIKSGFNSGLGIVCKNNGIVCIDYDKCIKDFIYNSDYGYTKAVFKDNASEQRILRDLNILDSYTEVSPSGKGIHIYLIANTSIDINTNKNDIEIYTNHFIRVSGNVFNEFMYNEMQEDKTKELEQIIKLYGLDASVKNNIINKKRDTIYTDILNKKFKYSNSFTNTEILNTMFSSKKGKLLNKLYDNSITDAELLELKDLSDASDVDKAKVDISNSGKAITLILHLLHFSYGDIKAVRDLFIKSALCKNEYLLKKYDNHTKDIIDSQFIPYAIVNYINYSE